MRNYVKRILSVLSGLVMKSVIGNVFFYIFEKAAAGKMRIPHPERGHSTQDKQRDYGGSLPAPRGTMCAGDT